MRSLCEQTGKPRGRTVYACGRRCLGVMGRAARLAIEASLPLTWPLTALRQPRNGKGDGVQSIRGRPAVIDFEPNR